MADSVLSRIRELVREHTARKNLEYQMREEMLARMTPAERAKRVLLDEPLDFAAGAARGSWAATLGIPGDLQALYRAAREVSPANRGHVLQSSLGALERKDTALPTTEQWLERLPPAGPSEQAQRGQSLGEWAPYPIGLPTAARGAKKGAKTIGALAAEAARRGVEEGRGPLATFAQGARPFYAVRPRGGNWDPDSSGIERALDDFVPIGEPELRDWTKRTFENYIKKDLGSPADPLLKLEKEFPQMTLGERDLAWAQQNLAHPDIEIDDIIAAHNKLSPDAPLTPWGYVTGETLKSRPARKVLDTMRGKVVWDARNQVTAALAAQMSPVQRKLFEYGDPGYHTRRFLYDLSETFEGGGTDAATGYDLQELIDRARKTDDPMLTPHIDWIVDQMTQATEAGVPEWLRKLPEDTPFWRVKGGDLIDTGLGIVPARLGEQMAVRRELLASNEDLGAAIAELRSRLNRGELHGAEADVAEKALRMADKGLLLKPQDLQRMSLHDATKRALTWGEELKAMKEEQAARGLRLGWTPHKEYPEGYRWVKFSQPEVAKLPERAKTEFPEGWRVEELTPEERKQYGWFGREPLWKVFDADNVKYAGAANADDLASLRADAWLMHTGNDPAVRQARQDLETGLGAEGEAMRHCVGGYCDYVLRGDTEIYSLRDPKGKPVITVEQNVGPQGATIAQVKGFGNAPVKEEHQAYLADFLNAQPWRDVSDRGYIGMNRIGGKFYPEQQLRDAWPAQETGANPFPEELVPSSVYGQFNDVPAERFARMLQASYPAEAPQFLKNLGLEVPGPVKYEKMLQFGNQRFSVDQMKAAWPQGQQAPMWDFLNASSYNEENWVDVLRKDYPAAADQVLHNLGVPGYAAGGLVRDNSRAQRTFGTPPDALDRALEDALMNLDLEVRDA